MSINRVHRKIYTSDNIHNSLTHSYGFDVLRHYSSRLKLKLLTKYIKLQNTVLDAGCANGLFSFAISSVCKKVHGIDVNQPFLNVARSNAKAKDIKNTCFTFGDIGNIPFEKEVFDCAYSYSTIVLVDDAQKAIKECIRVVKENGYIILDITGKYNLSQVYWRRYYKKMGHFSFNAFSYRELKKYLESNQVKIIESHALGFLDQWKYIPFFSHIASKLLLDKVFHASSFDLDYAVSNLPIIKLFSNRWYIVCQKT